MPSGIEAWKLGLFEMSIFSKRHWVAPHSRGMVPLSKDFDKSYFMLTPRGQALGGDPEREVFDMEIKRSPRR